MYNTIILLNFDILYNTTTIVFILKTQVIKIEKTSNSRACI